jgi:hypothetical protein
MLFMLKFCDCIILVKFLEEQSRMKANLSRVVFVTLVLSYEVQDNM